MSELVKLAYRSIGGFFAVLLMFIFGATGSVLIFAGAGFVVGAVYMVINPQIIDTLSITRIEFGQINTLTSADVGLAVFAFLVVTVVLFVIGSLFIASIFQIAKVSFAIDRELEKMVDANVGGSRDDKISKLERLGNLKDRGVLSEQEFQKEKAKLLQQIWVQN